MTNTLNGYIAGYDRKPNFEIRAASLYAARMLAEEHYKPSKAKRGTLWVELAELGSEQVTSVITA